MKGKIIRINRTLFELETGILMFGALCQLLVFLVEDRTGYSLGLWLGILIAAVSAFHMWWSLDKALDLGENQAVKTMSMHNILRYMFITVALILIAISGRMNPLSAFLGIMGLKASAYMHFITKKISTSIYGEEILPPLIEEPALQQDK
ncbi:MAG: ATP synthase subunit I [Lachnospiraceae bacterium]|nr:ATP synthase subunit I [Lachnospiraceae bacterium]MDE7332267.1 ATP synthase subunit I [Lachnospiraceae bacterium]